MQGSRRLFRATGGRFGALLAFLLALILVSPLVRGGPFGRVILDLLVTAAMISGLVAVLRRRRVFAVSLLLSLPGLAARWTYEAFGYEPAIFLALGMTSLFMGFVAAAILGAVLQETEVTVETIYASICVYLLLAALFGQAFEMIALSSPDAFDAGASMSVEAGEAVTRTGQPFFYFSMVTLTTLGYGDITPVAPIARVLASLEAVLGQLYLTILVARLVGLRIAGMTRQPPT